MQKMLLGPGVYIVKRRSATWPIVHVAVLVVGNQIGAPWWGSVAERLLELDVRGLRFDPYDAAAGWVLRGRIADETGAVTRIVDMLTHPPVAYDLFSNNCEHMASGVATGVRGSPQVRAALCAVAGLAFAMVALRAAAKAA